MKKYITKYVIKYGALYLYKNGNMFTINKLNARLYKSIINAEIWCGSNRHNYPFTTVFEILEVKINE